MVIFVIVVLFALIVEQSTHLEAGHQDSPATKVRFHQPQSNAEKTAQLFSDYLGKLIITQFDGRIGASISVGA